MKKIIIGMLHLLPLPGSPNYSGSIDDVLDRAKSDLENLLEGGLTKVNIENYGDIPFPKIPSSPITISSFTKIVTKLEQEFDFDFGIQVMRNDALSGMSIAHVTGASFIRVNVLTGAMIAEEGIVEGDARPLIELRKKLNSDVKVYADVLVKHAVPLGNQDLRLTAKATVERNMADGIIITGDITGEEASVDDLINLKDEIDKPILVGSGINKDNVKDLELKWVHAWPLPESIDGIEPRVGSIANSIIVDGIVYNRMEDLRISAIDAKTGKDIWSFQADPYLVNIEIAKRDLPVNVDFYPSLSSHAHSFSFAENKIFAPWPNCQVFGLDAKTGEIEFKLKTPTCKGLEGNEGLFKGLQSSGPVFDTVNRVLIYGTGGREAVEGGRGAFRGYSLDSGELLWTFYLMPPQDVGDPEWTIRVADKGWIQGIRASDIPEDILRNDWGECPDNCGFGKGDMGIGWGQWAVDEDKGIAYLATGNPSPSWNATYRPGPNVFSNSVLAIETKTGNLLWWHQIVAHDLGAVSYTHLTLPTKA